MLILFLFLIFIFSIFKKVDKEANNTAKLILVGSASLILLQAMIHIGVNIRLFPTTGMTLPFLSYGGSSIISVSILSGIILNLTKRKVLFSKVKKILITTGGTGGHVIPAKIIKEHLKNNFEIYYSTDLRGLKYLSSDINKTIIIDTPKFNLNFFYHLN